MSDSDGWDPEQYRKFRAQRGAPFFDLIGYVRRQLQRVRAIDLGCGTGELTAVLAERLDADVLGIDSSERMIAQAAPLAGMRLAFRQADISSIQDYTPYDLVFSNAALHWVPDHETLLPRVLTQLGRGAQIAVQVPTNGGHASHRVAAELARELGLPEAKSHVLPLARYAEILHEHGFRDQVCVEKIYGHELPRARDVVEWVKGTTLTPYLPSLDDSGREAFLAAYEKRLLAEIGDRAPYFYAFRRLLMWGQKT